MTFSTDTRDGHEMLRLLLQPPRSLCVSIGHYPHLPFQQPVKPTTARVPRYRDNFPRRTHGMPQAVATSRWSRPPQARLALPTPPSPPAWVSHSPLINCYFYPMLSEQKTDTLRRPTHRDRVKYKAEPQELCEQWWEREISPSSLRSRGLNLNDLIDVHWISGIPE